MVLSNINRRTALSALIPATVATTAVPALASPGRPEPTRPNPAVPVEAFRELIAARQDARSRRELTVARPDATADAFDVTANRDADAADAEFMRVQAQLLALTIRAVGFGSIRIGNTILAAALDAGNNDEIRLAVTELQSTPAYA